MILVFDVGNTETTVGLFDGEDLRGHWRLTTTTARTPDEIALLLGELLRSANIGKDQVTGSAIGSVVPPVTPSLAEACRDLFGRDPVIVDGTSDLPIRLQVDEPLTVGADRILNTLAASQTYRRDTIVVDLGTATTYDCITADGVFLGGVIQPGVITSAETLFRRTSQLAATEIKPPSKVIGTRTDDCIRAGVLYGASESIEGIVRRITEEWPGGGIPYVVATGGLAAGLQPYCPSFNLVEPFLTLRGLQLSFALLAR